jgi:hypothetical protein
MLEAASLLNMPCHALPHAQPHVPALGRRRMNAALRWHEDLLAWSGLRFEAAALDALIPGASLGGVITYSTRQPALQRPLVEDRTALRCLRYRVLSRRSRSSRCAFHPPLVPSVRTGFRPAFRQARSNASLAVPLRPFSAYRRTSRCPEQPAPDDPASTLAISPASDDAGLTAPVPAHR